MSLFRMPGVLAAWMLVAVGMSAALDGSGASQPPAPADPPSERWSDYRTILWIGDGAGKHPEQWAGFLQRLREMGINTGMVFGDGDPMPWVTERFPYYLENAVNRGLCLKFNSKAKDWDALVTEWAAGGRPERAFVRDFCLEDPAGLDWGKAEVRRIVSRSAPHRPLALDLRDELSVTISANPFDYDFSPLAQAGFRRWLREQYGDLAALNSGWGTQIATWDEVHPFSTDRIKRRMAGAAEPGGTGVDWQAVQRVRWDPAAARAHPVPWNLSPWCDFRTYMDLSLARALQTFRAAAKEIDPGLPVGIEGTQMPSAFGGYDLWRLAQVLDWVEPYDIGDARAIFGSFMRGRPMMTTVFETDEAKARRRLWHLLLEGDRGCIVWWSEDCLEWKGGGWEPTPKSRVLAPVLRELTSPLAALFLRAEKLRDPVALVYSQPSLQVDWLIESTVDGSNWPRRFSSFEADHNRLLRVRHAWLKLFEDLGYSPWFVAAEELPRRLQGGEIETLVLPQAYALSDAEVQAICTFAAAGGRHRVLADGCPGVFDGQGRIRTGTGLEGLFPLSRSEEASAVGGAVALVRRADIAQFAADRLRDGGDEGWTAWVRSGLGDREPDVELPAGARVRVHRYRLGPARLLAFERNIAYQMSEDLKQGGGNEALEKPVELEAKLKAGGWAYDLWTGAALGEVTRLKFRLDPWRPTLVALLDRQLPSGVTLVDYLGGVTAKARAATTVDRGDGG